ncbi:MAG: peptidase and chymotrypsin/Hap [Marmoricola sp.]|nr:peptidase and chymotrypsin/Hap [Marmoricola sp.]
MDQQNPYPQQPDRENTGGNPQNDETPTGPIGQPAGGYDQPAGGYDRPAGDHDQYTRPLPPYQSESERILPPYQPETSNNPLPPVVGPFYGSTQSAPAATTTASRRRGLTAAVLAGALVLGGAAGVGGAAAFHAFDDGGGSSSSNTSGPFQATKTSVVQDGTVEKVANSVLPSVVKVNVTGSSGAGSGSGIVLSKDGNILTNNHVVAGVGGNGSITVNFNDGTTTKATVVGTDPVTDIAVIKVDGVSDLVPAALGKSSALKVGQSVVAVGSPYGLNATVTSGIVSALNRPVSVSTAEEQSPQQQDPFGGGQSQQQGADLSTTYPAIQTDAAINPGNSGGALVDLSGRVVGINSSIRTGSSGGSTSDSGGSIGLGFAIPIDEVLPVVNQITQGEKPTHARLGVSVSDVTGNTLTQGAQLGTVEGGGAGAKAGLKKGDVITKVDDQVIDGSESLVATIRGHRPGEAVTITYLRDGKSSTTKADLGSDADSSAS